MTLEEVHEHLNEHLENELEDVSIYTAMANTAKQAGEDELAFWLWQIAHDEQSHAAWMRRYLSEAAYKPNASMGHQPERLELDDHLAHEWTAAMKNEDGSKGPHWTKEQTKLFMTQVGATSVEPVEFFAVMNAMYSDYCKVAKKYGVDKPEYYAELAKAWLEDKDAVEDKAARYYKCIVKH